MLKSEVLKFYGSAAAVARLIGISRSAVSQWGHLVPVRRAYELERLTNGKLKAPVVDCIR